MSISPKVSIIIPVYNVERFIERCVRSLFVQTLQEIEYIIVNDCTPDASIQVIERVLEEYPKRRPWVRIINMPQNSGQAKVREVGIKAATGDYIIHCDGDDWVDTDMYRVLYEKAIADDMDIVSCNYYATDDRTYCRDSSNALPEGKSLVSAIMSGAIHTSLCTRLVKRSIAVDSMFVFPQAAMFEDRVCMLQYALSTTRYLHIDKAYYYYYYHPGSLCFNTSVNASLKRATQLADNTQLIIEVLHRHNLLQKYAIEVLKLKHTARSMLFPAVLQEPKKYIRMWASMFPELNWKYPFLSSEPLTLRIIFVLTLWRIYPYLRKWLKV